MNLTLHELKARPRKNLLFTLECSGNSGRAWMVSAVGNAKWTGTPLAPILNEAEVLDKGIEAVFIGSDEGEEEVRGIKMKQNFARSMSLADAMNPNNLLCYEMNGEALPQMNAFPVRLIAPGWYGIANVKWLKRIEVHETRFMGRFMARDYVTIREEQRDGETVWMETSVGRHDDDEQYRYLDARVQPYHHYKGGRINRRKQNQGGPRAFQTRNNVQNVSV